MKLTLSCCLCPSESTAEIDVPDGWAVPEEIDEESSRIFCAEHAPVSQFVGAQCPGCVGGWGDCGLWSAFAYSHRRSLTEDDFAALTKGRCPKRVNGTFMSSAGRFSEMDLSEKADDVAGAALAQAIKDYWERYSEPDLSLDALRSGSGQRGGMSRD